MNIDYDKMWQELIESVKSSIHQLPHEKSVKEFAEETGLSVDAARDYLNRKVKIGEMSVRPLQVGRTKLKLYSPIIKDIAK